jgi:mRNA-degrading endonuclease RelE of RelBE toxin-antitoxin system
MQYEIEIRKRAEKDLAGIPKKDAQRIADATFEIDLKDLRKAKSDPMNQQGRSFGDVAKELGLKRKKILK